MDIPSLNLGVACLAYGLVTSHILNLLCGLYFDQNLWNMVRMWAYMYFFVLHLIAFSEECRVRKRCSLNGHQGPVHGVAMSPNGKILASG